MRTAWVDARAGLTGDMWLGALVSAGASLEAIERGVQALGIGEVRVTYAQVTRGGRSAAAVRVRPPAQTPHVATPEQVLRLVEFAALDDAVRARASAVLEAYVAAEAAATGTSREELTFHEVAMLDDLATVVGACVGLADLGIEHVLAGPVGVPGDDEGPFDLAVGHLLSGHVTRPLEGEPGLVTPAGAAVVAALATSAADPRLAVEAEGAGAASRDLPGAGLLHLVVGTPLPEDT